MTTQPYETSYQSAAADEVDTNTAAAVIAGLEIAGTEPIGDSARFHTLTVPAGARHEVFDLEALEEPLAAHPRRKKGTVHVQDAASFVGYLAKHGLAESEVFADLDKLKLVGVINAHEGTNVPVDERGPLAGHGDHRVCLELIHTDAWKAWTEHDKKPLQQLAFAEFIEDRANDVIDPDAATMLEIAQTLLATQGVDFQSANRLTDGQVQFRYEETTTARAGEAGELEIPQRFAISVAPFVGSAPVELVARFRYRIGPGGLTLFYALLNPTDVIQAAFESYADEVDREIVQPLFKGRPE